MSAKFLRLMSVLACAFVLSANASVAAAQKQKTFASPEEAVKELVAALKSGDAKATAAVLGAGSNKILQSGDRVADKAAGERFVKSYEEGSKLTKPDASTALLSVGKDDWPFPIPVIQDKSGWRFDAKAGEEEILNRRIGRNELAVIQVAQAYVDAQREYYLRNPQGDKLLQYSQKFISAQGKRDGLYYPVKTGEKPSPLGPLVAGARGEGYRKGEKSTPYHGYHYRILKSQGADAPGGAYSYVAQGRMIGGHAMVAWPVSYGNSGIMTFLVSHDGVVYEKDLGAKTAEAVQQITRFNPDKSWKKQ